MACFKERDKTIPRARRIVPALAETPRRQVVKGELQAKPIGIGQCHEHGGLATKETGPFAQGGRPVLLGKLSRGYRDVRVTGDGRSSGQGQIPTGQARGSLVIGKISRCHPSSTKRPGKVIGGGKGGTDCQYQATE